MSTVAKVIQQYRACAISHGEATLEGDHRRANLNHDLLMTALQTIEAEELGLHVLLPLLDHRYRSVRVWAAFHCLTLDQAKATAVLEDAAAGNDIISFNAKMVLSEWRSLRTSSTPEGER